MSRRQLTSVAFVQPLVDGSPRTDKLSGMTDLRCKLGQHDWRTYRGGDISGASYARQWCPRCGADSILRNGTRVEVSPGVWVGREPSSELDDLS